MRRQDDPSDVLKNIIFTYMNERSQKFASGTSFYFLACPIQIPSQEAKQSVKPTSARGEETREKMRLLLCRRTLALLVC